MIKVFLGIIVVIVIAGFTFCGVWFDRLDGKIAAQTDHLNARIETIPQRLSDEFRAMRAEMSAQTSAIANSIAAQDEEQ